MREQNAIDKLGFSRSAGASSDNLDMSCFTCGATSTFRDISRAMAKGAAAKIRQLGALSVAEGWERRAEMCERCPMRVIRRGVTYCGEPFLEQIQRDVATEGCGCPCRDKAKSPGEHCPIDSYGIPATADGECSCKWCRI